jgi:predicted enzyme related to lactoylglutathione lyase
MSEDYDYDSAWAHGCVFWNELQTHDIAAARKFYEDTLGLQFEPTAVGDTTYWMIFNEDGETVGGAFELNKPEMANIPERWLTFLSVDDVDARVKKAVAAGATILREPFDVPEVGRIAILAQPGGATIGWMTPVEDDDEYKE